MSMFSGADMIRAFPVPLWVRLGLAIWVISLTLAFGWLLSMATMKQESGGHAARGKWFVLHSTVVRVRMERARGGL